jgi:hypothetical protein
MSPFNHPAVKRFDARFEEMGIGASLALLTALLGALYLAIHFFR